MQEHDPEKRYIDTLKKKKEKTPQIWTEILQLEQKVKHAIFFKRTLFVTIIQVKEASSYNIAAHCALKFQYATDSNMV